MGWASTSTTLLSAKRSCCRPGGRFLTCTPVRSAMAFMHSAAAATSLCNATAFCDASCGVATGIVAVSVKERPIAESACKSRCVAIAVNLAATAAALLSDISAALASRSGVEFFRPIRGSTRAYRMTGMLSLCCKLSNAIWVQFEQLCADGRRFDATTTRRKMQQNCLELQHDTNKMQNFC